MIYVYIKNMHMPYSLILQSIQNIYLKQLKESLSKGRIIKIDNLN